MAGEGHWGHWPGDGGTHHPATSELSASWDVTVPGEWKSLLPEAVAWGPQADGALCSPRAVEPGDASVWGSLPSSSAPGGIPTS